MIFFYIYPKGYMGRADAHLVMEVGGKAITLMEADKTGTCKEVLHKIIAPPLNWKDLEVGDHVIQEATIDI